jgi:hypothetical protein
VAPGHPRSKPSAGLRIVSRIAGPGGLRHLSLKFFGVSADHSGMNCRLAIKKTETVGTVYYKRNPIRADEIVVREITVMSSRETSPVIDKDFIYRHAREIFGGPKKTYSWMNTPNRILKGMRPKDLIECGNEQDLQLVVEELNRIDQGIF